MSTFIAAPPGPALAQDGQPPTNDQVLELSNLALYDRRPGLSAWLVAGGSACRVAARRIAKSTAFSALVQFGGSGALFLAAFAVRCDGAVPSALWASAIAALPAVAAVKTSSYLFRGCHRVAGGSLTSGDFARRLEAAAIGSGALLAASLLTRGAWPAPGSVLVVDGGLTLPWLILTGGGADAIRRRYLRMMDSRRGRRVMVVGAGPAGVALASQAVSWPGLGLKIVGMLDADPALRGRLVAGVEVLGRPDDVASIASTHRVQEVLIPSPAVPAREARSISEACREAGLAVRVVPSFDALVAGHVRVEPGRVDARDILRREPVRLDSGSVRRDVESKSVLVTGAAGSIGSEICRQLLAFNPSRLVLLDHSENGLFYLEPELRRAAGPSIEVVPVIASIRDRGRLRAILDRHNPGLVIHAAAHKHVPMMEENPGEAVKTNVFGTKNLVDECLARGVGSFVMVSTDKAVNPTSVMGACKRLAEGYVQSRARETGARLVTVRFGNVLGSNGSVVPTFIEQVRSGGPVRVTHPEMTRYFMTIPEASQLVLQAGAQGRGGEIFVLDMGQPLRIVDVARTIIRLSGLKEGRDVDIVYTGLRPGEKLYEELYDAGEEPVPTIHPKIRSARHRPFDDETLRRGLDRLFEIVDGSHDEVRTAIADLVPGYTRKGHGLQPAQSTSEVRTIPPLTVGIGGVGAA